MEVAIMEVVEVEVTVLICPLFMAEVVEQVAQA